MRYRIVTAGSGFITQCKFKYWPFWGRVFFWSNYFPTIDAAETSIRLLIAYERTDGRVVKELGDDGGDRLGISAARAGQLVRNGRRLAAIRHIREVKP